MYAIVVGGGKVGLNLARELMQKGNEVTLIEGSRRRYMILEPQLEHVVHLGDGTELWVLERAGIERADMVIAVTGDDEDNIIIAQVAREKYGRDKIIARCNNIRNMEHFDLLGIKPVVSSTDLILRLIEHEVPQYGLVHLLKLQAEDLEIIEVEVSVGSAAAGKTVEQIDLPEGSLLIAILREGSGFVPRGDTVIESGDEVLLVLNPGIEDGITKLFNAPEESFA
jgi:trk system potassium uptake protein TrkA